MVPLAVDAGLGELGRLGYLITKEFGPRVRLGVVTTDLPLVPDKPVDLGVQHFCSICKKCAVCCPSHSIPPAEQSLVNGMLRWKLNDETCFDYWGKIGTDCNICMRVCPYSHAKTFPHRLIVWFITRNKHARRLFSFMDDVFYGKKPKARPAPRWSEYQ
jgi:epoxyqueuosine reductase QueG